MDRHRHAVDAFQMRRSSNSDGAALHQQAAGVQRQSGDRSNAPAILMSCSTTMTPIPALRSVTDQGQDLYLVGVIRARVGRRAADSGFLARSNSPHPFGARHRTDVDHPFRKATDVRQVHGALRLLAIGSLAEASSKRCRGNVQSRPTPYAKIFCRPATVAANRLWRANRVRPFAQRPAVKPQRPRRFVPCLARSKFESRSTCPTIVANSSNQCGSSGFRSSGWSRVR